MSAQDTEIQLTYRKYTTHTKLTVQNKPKIILNFTAFEKDSDPLGSSRFRFGRLWERRGEERGVGAEPSHCFSLGGQASDLASQG